MRTLLIWDQFGEADLGLYVIEDAPDWLVKCRNHFINHARTPEEIELLLGRVSDALCENPKYYGNKDDELVGAWVKYKVDIVKAVSLTGTFQLVITGLIP